VKLACSNPPFAFLSWLKAASCPCAIRALRRLGQHQFGKRLFNTFFKSYTEKVWGMSCREISADWARATDQGLSLGSAIKKRAFPATPSEDSSKVIKTLINSFKYPRRGPGMMWERCAEKNQKYWAARSQWGCRVIRCQYDDANGT